MTFTLLRRFVTQVVIVFVALAAILTSGAPAQSLGDVARQEESRRKATANGKVYTNDDLRGAPAPAASPAQPPAATPAPGPAPADATKPEAKGDAKPAISFPGGEKIILGCNVQSTGQAHATVFGRGPFWLAAAGSGHTPSIGETG